MTVSFREIEKSSHDAFLSGHCKEHFMQSSVWGQIKSAGGAWHEQTVGLFCDDELKASAMLLWRKLPVIGKKLYYAPRGFVIDYSDWDLVALFTQQIKDFIKKNGAVYLLVDPDHHYQVQDEYDNVLKEKDDFVEKMISLGYRHNGFNMGFEGTQPRYTFRLYLEGTIDDVYGRFDRFTKKNLRQCEENGIEVYEEDNIDLFYEIMTETAVRDNFVQSPKAYYDRVYHTLKPLGMSNMYFAKYSPARHLELINGQLEQAQKAIGEVEAKLAVKDTPKQRTALLQANQKKERFEKLRATAEKYQQEYPEGIVLSTGININSDHRGWTIFGGSRPILREMNANYAITYHAIKEYHKKGMEFMDFFGTIGNPAEGSDHWGIHRFKKKFSGRYVEFPGEFHLVVNKFWYKLWNTMYPIGLKAAKGLKKALRRG